MYKLVQGFAILSSAHLLGEFLRHFLRIPIPGNVLGFAIVAFALFNGWLKLEMIEESAGILLEYLSLFFAPVIVGTILYWDLIRAQWLPMGASVVVGTIGILIITGKIAEKFFSREEG
ncbi:MAG: CidA/LrgA family protein [Limnochordia bacterium]|jgi:holin-like protein